MNVKIKCSKRNIWYWLRRTRPLQPMVCSGSFRCIFRQEGDGSSEVKHRSPRVQKYQTEDTTKAKTRPQTKAQHFYPSVNDSVRQGGICGSLMAKKYDLMKPFLACGSLWFSGPLWYGRMTLGNTNNIFNFLIYIEVLLTVITIFLFHTRMVPNLNDGGVWSGVPLKFIEYRMLK